jgi:hypothetical protein
VAVAGVACADEVVGVVFASVCYWDDVVDCVGVVAAVGACVVVAFEDGGA